MRRQWTRTGLYLAGLLTLPGLCSVGWVVSQRALAQSDDALFGPNETLPLKELPVGTVVFDQPVRTPADVPPCPLPVRAEMLASETPDAAEAEKTVPLRERLRKVIEEKAELLTADALSAEIALHQRQIEELKALREMQRLEQSLKELSDKYPESEAAHRARGVLDYIQQSQQRRPGGPAPIYSPNGSYNSPRYQSSPRVAPRPDTQPFPEDSGSSRAVPRKRPPSFSDFIQPIPGSPSTEPASP